MRSPPVPSREPKCLKEVPQEPEDIAGWELGHFIFYVPAEGIDVSV